jgi:hypothetical protein
MLGASHLDGSCGSEEPLRVAAELEFAQTPTPTPTPTPSPHTNLAAKTNMMPFIVINDDRELEIRVSKLI